MNSESRSTRSWCGDLTALDRRNQWRYVFWALAWMASFVGATFLLKQSWAAGTIGYVVAFLPNLPGVGAVMAFVHFLRHADELQRKIQLEALGWGFGCGAIFMIGYQLLERAGLPRIDTSSPLMVMVVCWAVATIVVARRYS